MRSDQVSVGASWLGGCVDRDTLLEKRVLQSALLERRGEITLLEKRAMESVLMEMRGVRY